MNRVRIAVAAASPARASPTRKPRISGYCCCCFVGKVTEFQETSGRQQQQQQDWCANWGNCSTAETLFPATARDTSEKRSRRHSTSCVVSRGKSHDLHFAKHGGSEQERNGKQNKLPAILTPFGHAESERELGWWCCQLANGPSDEESGCSWNWLENWRRSGQKSLQVDPSRSLCMCGQIPQDCWSTTAYPRTGRVVHVQIIQIPPKLFGTEFKESASFSKPN